MTEKFPVGATEYHLWVDGVRLPGACIGQLSRGQDLAGAQDVKVELIHRDQAGGNCRVQRTG